MLLDSAPYVDAQEFERLRADWSAYVQRMAAYGNTGVVVPVFLELASFDSVPAIYAGTAFGPRHRATRARFRELFALARGAGLEVYLATDMAPLTPPLAQYLGRHGGIEAANPKLWATYRRAVEEIFEQAPEVAGIVVRVGEAGALYNRAGWDYRSELLVGTVAGLRSMLRALLPAFEARGRTLILRSWSVGVGELGKLHTDPAVYERALGDVTSPSLIVSTKIQAGDFFRHLPVNPTLLSGSHRRIVELQARREFEGFTAFPNFLGRRHGEALAAVRAANPNVLGTWLWTQSGGPLRAGPMSLYPLRGFWLWIDANVYAASRQAAEPDVTPAALAAGWVRRELSDDPRAVEALTWLLLRSPDVVERGLYIRPFAQRHVTYAGLDLPPLLWIMEWDVVGGWSAVWSAIYDVTRPRLAEAVADGFAAAAAVGRMQDALARARPGLSSSRPAILAQMERSLAYERSLLDALAWYRAAMLYHYRWLDTGDRAAYDRWRTALPAFQARARAHAAAFAGDLDFPAFDFAPGLRSVELLQSASDARWQARGLLVVLALAIGFGLVPAAGRWLGDRVPGGDLAGAVAALVAALGLTAGTATSFVSPWPAATIPIALGAFTAVLRLGHGGARSNRHRDVALAAALAPLLWVAIAIAGAMSVRGPQHLWYLLWSGGGVRALLITIIVAVPLSVLLELVGVGRRVAGRSARAAAGSVLMAASATLLLLAALAPRIERILASLDHPLSLAPMTHAIVVGMTTYTHLPAIASRLHLLAGALLVLGAVLALPFGQAATRDRALPTASA